MKSPTAPLSMAPTSSVPPRAALNPNPNPTSSGYLSYTAYISYAALAIILGLALYLRLDRLGDVQRWTDDQNYFYYIIMDWFEKGKWPLLGVYRSIHGDRSLGPGWFYLLAPSLWISGCHLIAGAVTQVIFTVVAIFLDWLWILRTTGSRLAALATAAIFAFSPMGVACDRVLWNPNIMPFAVIALACLIDRIEWRPVSSLALILIFFAVLPQWHTIGVPIIIAALPPVAWAAWDARGRFREASRRCRFFWATALFVVLLVHYLPPIIYELGPHPSNLRHYLQNSMLPPPAVQLPLAWRAAAATRRLVTLAATQTFFMRPTPLQVEHSLRVAVAAVLVFLWVGGRHWIKNRRVAPLSLLFFLFLLGGNWLILVLGGAEVRDYFVLPALAMPVLLLGWAAGRLLKTEAAKSLRALPARAAGLLLVTVGLTMSALHFHQAWGVHKGRVSYGFSMRDSRQIVEYILKDAGGRPASLLYTDAAGNSTMFMHTMLRTRGFHTANGALYLNLPTPRSFLGERLYVVARGGLNKEPRFEGPAIPLGKPAQVADAWVYRIPVDRIPAGIESVFAAARAPQWFLRTQ